MARIYFTLHAAAVRFVCRRKRVAVMTSTSRIPCLYNIKLHALEKHKVSWSYFNELWLYEVMNTAVLLLISNAHAGNDLQQNTTDSAQGTYLELHTWYSYENSDRCNTDSAGLHLRNLSDIRRSGIFRGYIDKNFHTCPFKVYVRTMPP
jgi:hypothetical protein